MHLFIEDNEVSVKVATLRGMNYGQPARGMETHVYKMYVKRSEFIEKLQPVYEKFVSEEKAEAEDAILEERGLWPELDDLRNLGFPPLATLLDDHSSLTCFVIKWLEMELLDIFLTPVSDIHAETFYVLNSVDNVEVIEGVIFVSGDAFASKAV